MTDRDIRQMLERRGAEAGAEGVHRHRFRHSFANAWPASGGLGADLSSPQGRMMARLVTTFAEFERELISQRTKDGLAAAPSQRHQDRAPDWPATARIANHRGPDRRGARRRA
jgi:hypothetical protein